MAVEMTAMELTPRGTSWSPVDELVRHRDARAPRPRRRERDDRMTRRPLMQVNKGSFLVMATTLAGGAGGYFASEKHILPHLEEWKNGRQLPAPPPQPAVVAEPRPVADAAPPAPTAAAPACDDNIGTPADCPPPGYPTIEGGCGSFAANRCAEFKQAMKPRVAQAATECLAKLTPQERCDPNRVNLCGHLALMNACPDPDGPADAGDTAPLSSCRSIAQTCGPSVVAPSLAECRQVLSGMNAVGRERMVQCMKKHCFDKGVLGCEALPPR